MFCALVTDFLSLTPKASGVKIQCCEMKVSFDSVSGESVSFIGRGAARIR